MVSTAAGGTIYVDADASGSNNGSSWADAYNYLQDALAVAGFDNEIWVAEGIYKPDEDTANPGGTGDRTATFQLKNGVAIYGGFAGTETSLGQWDWQAHETILSGDLNGDDIGVADPADLLDEPTHAENSYHVVTGSGTDATAILDGFTIIGGQADGPWVYEHDRGGGMYNSGGSPTLVNCKFRGNSAPGPCSPYGDGGGMYNSGRGTLTNCTFTENSASSLGGGMYNSGRPTLTNCTFTGNWAEGLAGGMCNRGSSSPTLTNCTFSGNRGAGGGGMVNDWNSNPTLTNCTFSDNSGAEWQGGGMANYSSSPMLTRCTFSSNSGASGGGMYNLRGNPTLTNCTFISNVVTHFGGGMYNHFPETNPTLINCTFSGNEATSGGGIHNSNNSRSTLTNCAFTANSASYAGGGMYNSNSSSTLTNCTFSSNSAGLGGGMWNKYSSSTITNCIFWGNTHQEIYVDSGTEVITYNDIQGGWIGEGNMDAPPLFVDAANGDYHLLPDSPCIDAGTNTPPGELPSTDIEGNPRIHNGVVDMGAYEWQGPSVVTVEIDIKPGSYPNAINLGSYGLIPVAILSSADFDATTVDPDTVALAGAGVAVRGKGSKLMAHEEDVNGDGLVDLVVQVETENLNPDSFQDGYAILTGSTYDGQAIEGVDEIRIVPLEPE